MNGFKRRSFEYQKHSSVTATRSIDSLCPCSLFCGLSLLTHVRCGSHLKYIAAKDSGKSWVGLSSSKIFNSFQFLPLIKTLPQFNATAVWLSCTDHVAIAQSAERNKFKQLVNDNILCLYFNYRHDRIIIFLTPGMDH